MERLEDVKWMLKEEFLERKGCGESAHGVTFKSPTAIENEDRMVIEWDVIENHSWVLLAVFDGHSGSATANYAAQRLPRILRGALKELIDKKLQRCVDRAFVVDHADAISAMLKTEIRKFDDNIGRAVRKLFKSSERFTEAQAMRSIDEHEEIIERAFQGTTIALALINADLLLLWAVGLGDSTVALSVRTPDDIDVREADRLCEKHTLNAPGELQRVSSSHPSEDVADEKYRLLGLLPNVSRSIGHFHLKCDSAFLDRLFSFLPHSGPDDTPLKNYVSKIKTPPYVSSKASVRFVDYLAGQYWDRYPILMLFTQGVDKIVNGYDTPSPDAHDRTDPADAVTSLLGLSPPVMTKVEGILGHKPEIRWNPGRKNRAVDVLGNLLGGTDTNRLKSVISRTRPMDSGQHDGGDRLDLDDTTIILCDLWILQTELQNIRRQFVY